MSKQEVKKLIDGKSMTFLEFKQDSSDLKKWRDASVAPPISVLIPDQPSNTVSEPWNTRGLCQGCWNYAKYLPTPYVGNPFVGCAQGHNDCFCDAQGDNGLTDDEFLVLYNRGKNDWPKLEN